MKFCSFCWLGRRFSASFLFACALISRTVHADPAASDISAAKLAFESAVSLETERHWAEAAVKLRQAIAVKDTPGLRFHLAHCELEQGHLIEASFEYDRASELLRRGAKAPDVQKLLGPASDALKSRIPRVTVELPPDLGAVSASIDGKVYPPSELALGVPLNPGRHSLRVLATGRRPFDLAFMLEEGEPVTLRPKLALAAPASEPAAVAPPVPPAEPSSAVLAQSAPAAPPHASSAKLYLLIGESVLTAAGLGLGIAGQLMASSATDRVTTAQGRIDAVDANDGSACARPDLGGACADLRRAISDHDDAMVLSEVGFIAAGVGAASLVTTWLVYPDSSSSSAGLHVQPMVSLGRVGLIGSF